MGCQDAELVPCAACSVNLAGQHDDEPSTFCRAVTNLGPTGLHSLQTA